MLCCQCVIMNTDLQHMRNSLRWRHNGLDSVPNHQPHDCLLNRSFGYRSKKTSKLRVTGLCVVNSPVTGEFPAQMASNAENVSIWWRHHVKWLCLRWFETLRPSCNITIMNLDKHPLYISMGVFVFYSRRLQFVCIILLHWIVFWWNRNV